MNFDNPVLCEVDENTGVATSMLAVPVDDDNLDALQTSILQTHTNENGNNIHNAHITSLLRNEHASYEISPGIDIANLTLSTGGDINNADTEPISQLQPAVALELTSSANGTEISQNLVPDIGLSHRPLHMHGSRFNRAGRERMSEERMFQDILDKSGVLFRLLQESWSTTNCSLKVTQIAYDNRAFAMLTAITKQLLTEQSPNITKYKYFGCVLWQTSKNPPRGVCITMTINSSIHERSNNNSPIFMVCCSCNPSLWLHEINDSACGHLTCFLTSTTIRNLFESTLRENHELQTIGRYFGSPLSEGQSYPCIHLLRSAQNTIRSEEGKDWSFYVQFDTDRSYFIPLVLVKRKKIQCLFCRGHRNRRGACAHELNWEKEIIGGMNGEDNEFDENESDMSEEDLEPFIEDELQHQHNNGRRTKEVFEKYGPKNLKLPILPCKGIQGMTRRLTCEFEDSSRGGLHRIPDYYGVCRKCNYKRGKQDFHKSLSEYRATRLYTLNHCIRIIEVEDWTCPSCKSIVYFTGVGQAIFPVRKTFAYTYELLYFFVHNVCRLGISFRTQYDSYHMMQISQSAKVRFDSVYGDHGNVYIILDDSKSGRRRCAEAFRLFLPCIDVSNSSLCSKLFTCKNCEVELTEEEKTMCGLQIRDGVPIKHFKALVVDGTNAGILDTRPHFKREPVHLTVNPRLRKDQRFIRNKMFQTAIVSLFKVIRKRLRTIVSGKKSLPLNSSYLQFVLPLMSSEKRDKSIRFSKEGLACLRYLLCDDRCFCDDGLSLIETSHNRSRHMHTKLCRKVTKGYEQSVSGEDIYGFLRTIVSLEIVETEPVNTKFGEDNEDTDCTEEEENQLEFQDVTLHSSPGSYHLRSAARISVQDLGNYVSGENMVDIDGEEVDYEEEFNDENSLQGDDAVQSDTSDTVSTIRRWFVRVNISKIDRCGQLLESFLNVMQFMLLDNISLPYIRPCRNILNASNLQQRNEDRRKLIFTEHGTVKLCAKSIGYDSIGAHEQLADSLENLADCEHLDESNVEDIACAQCIHTVAMYSSIISEINPIYSRFVDQLLLHIRFINTTATVLASEFGNAIREHIQMAQIYFENIKDNLSEDCQEYWTKFSSPVLPSLPQSTKRQYKGSNGNLTTNSITENGGSQLRNGTDTVQQMPEQRTNQQLPTTEETVNNNSGQVEGPNTNRIEITSETRSEQLEVTDNSADTGISFPGRRQYRPLFRFDQMEDKHCGKRYASSSTHTPGVLVVMCACSHPKLIGFIVMTRAESTSLALSSVLMFFQKPPAVMLYDNACNTLAAALLRLPWLMMYSLLIVDRFHYKGHTCNSFFDADLYRLLDSIKSSAAESINAKIKRALYHMRFLRGNLLVFYLNVRFALLNLTTIYCERKGKSDVEDIDLNEFYANLVQCNCTVTQLDDALNIEEYNMAHAQGDTINQNSELSMDGDGDQTEIIDDENGDIADEVQIEQRLDDTALEAQHHPQVQTQQNQELP